MDSRGIRQRLVRLAQEGAPALRVLVHGVPAGDGAGALLRECTLLGFSAVTLRVRLAEIEALDNPALYGLRGLTRVDLLLDAPSRCAQAAEQLSRVRRLCGAEAGVIACPARAGELQAFARAFDDGSLPGPPRYAVSGRRDTLLELGKGIDELPAASAGALGALLPLCVRNISGEGPGLCATLASSSCPEERPDCPGLPGGWSFSE